MPPTRVALICPAYEPGGTNLLFGRLGLLLQSSFNYEITVIDFVDGKLRQMFLDAGCPHRYLTYTPGQPLRIDNCDIALIPVLSASLIGTSYLLSPDARLLMWCTAPQDLFKWLPAAFLFNRASWKTKSLLAQSAFKAQSSRILRLIQAASEQSGLAFMDTHNLEVNQFIFGHFDQEKMIPICTNRTFAAPIRRPSTGRSLYWVGRVEDFKTQCLRAVIRATLESGTQHFDEVVIIGDGKDLNRLKREFPSSSVKWLGKLSPSDLESELLDNAIAVFGHGTSILEAAKNLIPSLVVDACYSTIPPSKLKAEWLHRCRPTFVGKISHPAELSGRPYLDCIAELQTNCNQIGLDCRTHWDAYHSPESVAAMLDQLIKTNSFHVKEFEAIGANRPGSIGSAINWAKRALGRRW